ncbi:MAG: thioredoxin fold domain-containing protein [Nitrospirae bacterium]|nr:thioredoxin fold domain-containing protein [Nitrospirota bacterium]
MKKVIKDRKDIAFFNILYPLPMHKEAYGKSKAIICEQSLELLEAAFEKKALPAPTCETTVIDQNIKLAEKLGISGTPAVIFPNGTLIPGAMSADDIIKQIDKK